MGYRAGVVGAAGFAGIELVRLLSRHPEFDLAAATSDALAGTPIAKAYPAFTGVTDLAFSTHEDTDFSAFDVVFLAVPHKAAMGMAPDLMAAGVTVVDLSADFRLKDPAIYEKWYAPHTATDLLAQAAFGLPELTGDELAAAAERRAAGEAVLVGCAGCYPTATSLAAAPAIRAGLVDAAAPVVAAKLERRLAPPRPAPRCRRAVLVGARRLPTHPCGPIRALVDRLGVVADAVSGVTAGKKATSAPITASPTRTLEAYGVGCHRHTPEIEQIPWGWRAGSCSRTHLLPRSTAGCCCPR